MPALSFSVFRDKIESGAKRQTIRGDRKRPIKVGHKLYLYWKQQCASECEKLGEAICTKISTLEIHDDCYLLDPDIPTKGNGRVVLDSTKMQNLAIADGFNNWNEMIEFLAQTYGLPFRGVLIEWDRIKSPF